MTLQPTRTHIPSHIHRHAAWAASGSGMSQDTWLEQQWHQFCRAAGRKRRNGITQAEFDQYLTETK